MPFLLATAVTIGLLAAMWWILRMPASEPDRPHDVVALEPPDVEARMELQLLSVERAIGAVCVDAVVLDIHLEGLPNHRPRPAGQLACIVVDGTGDAERQLRRCLEDDLRCVLVVSGSDVAMTVELPAPAFDEGTRLRGERVRLSW